MNAYDTAHLRVHGGNVLRGEVCVAGAKNAALCTMAALLLARGTSRLRNIPAIADVYTMMELLRDLGAQVSFDPEAHVLDVCADGIRSSIVAAQSMRAMRASMLVMGPLLARLGKAFIPYPGGCDLMQDRRPVNYHAQAFRDLGVEVQELEDGLQAHVPYQIEHNKSQNRLIFDYPSVGATENILMYAVLRQGTVTTIINAAHEPEVLDLIGLLNAMGARIRPLPGSSIEIEGVASLYSVDYTIISDRLEAGSLLLAAAVTGGTITIPNIDGQYLEIFLDKLMRMGHQVLMQIGKPGVILRATKTPRAIGFKTGPYPGFPTDLQAPMMVAQLGATGSCSIEETVFDKRFTHVDELIKLGANITIDGSRALVTGGAFLQGTPVSAHNIRAGFALVLAGLAARGETQVYGVRHWRRGYENLEEKLRSLGADIHMVLD